MLNKRTNLLFNQELWDQLMQLAKKKNTSVGKLVRTAVEDYYELKEDSLQQIQKACKAIEEKRIQGKGKIDYKALINYGRKV